MSRVLAPCLRNGFPFAIPSGVAEWDGETYFNITAVSDPEFPEWVPSGASDRFAPVRGPGTGYFQLGGIDDAARWYWRICKIKVASNLAWAGTDGSEEEPIPSYHHSDTFWIKGELIHSGEEPYDILEEHPADESWGIFLWPTEYSIPGVTDDHVTGIFGDGFNGVDGGFPLNRGWYVFNLEPAAVIDPQPPVVLGDDGFYYGKSDFQIGVPHGVTIEGEYVLADTMIVTALEGAILVGPHAGDPPPPRAGALTGATLTIHGQTLPLYAFGTSAADEVAPPAALTGTLAVTIEKYFSYDGRYDVDTGAAL